MIARFQNFFNWAGQILRYNGPMVLLWRLLQRAVHHFGRLELVTIFKKDLSQPLKEVEGPPGITIAQAAESDVEALLRRMGERFRTQDMLKLKEYEDLIRRRIQKGSLCFLGKMGGEIIHYNWITFNWDESLGGRFLHLQDDEALCLDGFTPEKWRGKGVHPVVHYQMLYFLQQNGYRKAFTLVDTDNKSSKKTHHLQGWLTLGVVLCFTPRKASKGWIWTLKGNLSDFLKDQPPASS